jgi:hypothetical protein
VFHIYEESTGISIVRENIFFCTFPKLSNLSLDCEYLTVARRREITPYVQNMFKLHGDQ